MIETRMNAALQAAKAAGVAACKAGLRSVAKTGMTPGGHQRILRCGAIATKLGMSRMWDKNGSTHPLTLLQARRPHLLLSHPPISQASLWPLLLPLPGPGPAPSPPLPAPPPLSPLLPPILPSSPFPFLVAPLFAAHTKPTAALSVIIFLPASPPNAHAPFNLHPKSTHSLPHGILLLHTRFSLAPFPLDTRTGN